LTEERPKKQVKIMGEELVLFRSPDGGYGLVAEHCSHRGASLYYGFLEGNCIRCAYHGWMYDPSGRIVETPFEPEQSMLRHTLRHPAYPVQELGGLLFTYMGPPEKQPLLPHWDVLVRQDGKRDIEIRGTLQANWLQAQENSADSTHQYFLHAYYDAMAKGLKPEEFNQRPMERYGFQPFRWGVMKSLIMGGAEPQLVYDRPVIFPNVLRIRLEMHWRVPIDDTSTRIFWTKFVPSKDGSTVEQPEIQPFRYAKPWKDENGEYLMDTAQSQDGMAWETQGPLYDRTKENIGASDYGVALYREMLLEQIEVVRQGGEPIGLVRDPEENEMIDIWSDWMGVRGATGEGLSTTPHGKPFEEIFDDRYVEFEVPVGAARPA
jgi:5,5'-dehydrodivanillate O-demethylase